jgi:hypothetical protein
MPRARRVRIARFVQPLLRVRRHGFEHPVALAAASSSTSDFSTSAARRCGTSGASSPPPATDDLGGWQRKAAGKDRETHEKPLLIRIQQVVAPIDQRPQGLLPRQGRAAPSRQQPEAIAEARGDLLHRQRAHSRGSELDGERNAIQPLTNLRQRRRVPARHGEGRLRRLRTVDEEPYRLVRRSISTLTSSRASGWARDGTG